jgi:membrane protease subunit (stomatin/prohibitin family)
MDVSDASYYIFNEKEIKVAKWGTPKKIFRKN